MMLDNHPGTFTLLQIHVGDAYATTWGNSRYTFYSVPGTPTAWFDGVESVVGAGSTSSAYTNYNNKYNTRRAVPTDVTIQLTGSPAGGQTYQITATVCIEPGGTGKTLRVHIAQVLDYWPASPTYHRYGFKQAAAYQDVTLSAGQCQQVVRTLTFDSDSWSHQSDIKIVAWAQQPSTSGPANVYQAATIHWPFLTDCNDNGIDDSQDIAHGTSEDCDSNGTPDECQPDCNSNGVADACDIAQGTSGDCDGNGTPDECQPDCNSNGVADTCDIAQGTSEDCDGNGTPDECEPDCNTNGVADSCDIAGGTSVDCQPDGIPDECELSSNDCNANNTPDECEPDCNTNAVPDDCDITAGTSHDCNTNGRPDECDVFRCYDLWDGFQPNPPFSNGRPVSQIDYNGDGFYWINPKGNATISPIGCETQELSDNAVKTTVPGTGPPEDGYVSSEYFITEGGVLPPDEEVYTLSFRPKLEGSLNPKTDWQFFIYDAQSNQQVIQIQFASTVSTLVGAANRGYIVVKNPAGSPSFISTGVRTSLYTCYEFKVALNNKAGTVELYIDDLVTPKVATIPLAPAARRMDYFRLQAVSNGAPSGGTTVFLLDYFGLCTIGSKVPPDQFPDCNANGFLDACDIAAGTSEDCNGNGIPDECGGADFGDFNGDGAIDLTDYQVFETCLTGPCISPPCDPPLYAGYPGPCCAIGDADRDGAIDLSDFAGFQGVFTGTP
ncbi:MAG: hypothetical protein V2A79_19370 [Planctomycetota bacterium]